MTHRKPCSLNNRVRNNKKDEFRVFFLDISINTYLWETVHISLPNYDVVFLCNLNSVYTGKVMQGNDCHIVDIEHRSRLNSLTYLVLHANVEGGLRHYEVSITPRSVVKQVSN